MYVEMWFASLYGSDVEANSHLAKKLPPSLETECSFPYAQYLATIFFLFKLLYLDVRG